ncbi:hypothetical protein KA062_01485 [Patescibacteria group bacterium]|jgi:hypothetical protein|nr:hypothetical protein [Patescibacteria group bacterium]
MVNLLFKRKKRNQENVFRPTEELILEECLRTSLALKGLILGKEYQDSFKILTYSITKPGFLRFLSIGSIIIRNQLQEVDLWVYRLGNYWVDDLKNTLSALQNEIGHSIKIEVFESF